MKLITLKTLIMHNFMVYKDDVELDFEGKDITGILAEYEDDSTRSNRAGKSCILEAICYNLTGISRAKDETKLIHHGEKEMWVTCIYSDGEKDYTIKRGRDHKKGGILEVDWIQKVSECQDEIEKLFGITPKDFLLTSFFKQADTAGFMKMKPSEKSAFLMQWLDNEHWREKEEKANEDRKVVKEKLRDNENLKKVLEASLEIDESLESIIYELNKENKELELEKNELSENLGVANNSIKNINTQKADIQEKIRGLKAEKSNLEVSIEGAAKADSAYQQCRVDYKTTKESLAALGEASDVEAVTIEIDSLKEKRSELNNNISIAKNHSGGICPVIKQSCDRIKFDAKDVSKWNKELSSVGLKIDELTKELRNNDERSRIQNRLEVLQEKGKRLKSGLVDTAAAHERISEISDLLLDASSELQKLDINVLQNKKQEIVEAVVKLNAKIKENSNTVLDHEIRVSEAKKAKEKIDIVTKSNIELQEKLTLLNYTCFMFSKNGIPALEIENSFQEIEDNINWILEEILTGVTVAFSPDKELVKLEPVCTCGFQFPKGFRGGGCPECESPRQKMRKEEISFKIIENGIEQDFEMDSGGGMQLISYAVRIALTMLKRGQRKCNLNMLFLDEVDSALDPFLAAQIIGSITNFLTKKLGYEQVILVSHKEQIKSSVPYIIKVTKHDSYSTAKFM